MLCIVFFGCYENEAGRHHSISEYILLVVNTQTIRLTVQRYK